MPLGRVDKFVVGEDSWDDYYERLQCYFTANDIDDTKKVAVLLSLVGPKTYNVLKGLCCPTLPSACSLPTLANYLKSHFSPKRSVILSRYTFNSCVQLQNESISDFVASLKKLVGPCQYASQQEEMLRDRFVVGLKDKSIQIRLLAEPDSLTFQKALELACALELADKGVKDIRGNSTSMAVHGVNHSKHSDSNSNTRLTCYSCGGPHLRSKCKFRNYICNKCHLQGHLSKVCRRVNADNSRVNATPPKVHQKNTKYTGSKTIKTHAVSEINNSNYTHPSSEDGDIQLYHVTSVHASTNKKGIRIPVLIQGKEVDFELDTGSGFSLICEKLYKERFSDCTLQRCDIRLLSYTKDTIFVLGEISVDVELDGQKGQLPLVIVKGNGPSLLGRNWLQHLRVDWHSIFSVHTGALDSIMKRHEDVFSDKLGCFKGPYAKIHLDSKVKPLFHKTRSVPYSMKTKIESELDRLVSEGILEHVDYSEWAAPVVPVVKPDGSLRLCGDYKVTVNQACKVDKYPLPRIQDLFSTLSGGQQFTKLDMSQAYQQVTLDSVARDCLVINTHKGLFRPTRLPYGVSSAPGIFQRIMDGLLGGLSGLAVYLDDILITGSTLEEHLRNLNKVLTILAKVGFRLKREKCSFLQDSVVYLGHRIDSNGLHTMPDKVEAISKCPDPYDIHSLRAFLGLVGYYRTFIPNLAEILYPLYQLLKGNTSWSWSKIHVSACNRVRNILSSSPVLAHFDSKIPLVMDCDASGTGLDAVLSHRFPDGTEKPIGYVSRTLTVAEAKYSNIEREALSIIFGIRKFHPYLWGNVFTLRSDHKPLKFLFGEHRGVPSQASVRIQRWALALSAYQYVMEFRSGNKISNADGLSRLPLPITTFSSGSQLTNPPEYVHLIKFLNDSLITSSQIKLWTMRDPVLSRVKFYIENGWPNQCPDDLIEPFFKRFSELTVFDDCVFWGTRIIIPQKARETILLQLHDIHTGMSRIKSLARSYFWWPCMDRDIENLVGSCEICARNQNSPSVAPVLPWKWPEEPWSRIHIDHAGPFQGHLLLIVVDSHSKWLEVLPVSSTNSSTTIENLRRLFATHGLPKTLVSDNASGFTSSEFQVFLKRNGIRHITSSPYHPATNGLAERAVQTVKAALKKNTEGNLSTRLLRFLFRYRTTPHSLTGKCPSELLMGRKLRIHFDALHPNLREQIHERQASRVKARKLREFNVGEKVLYRTYGSPGQLYLPGVVKSYDQRNYVIATETGDIRRHIDQLVSSRQVSEATPMTTLPNIEDKGSKDDDPFPSVSSSKSEKIETAVPTTDPMQSSPSNKQSAVPPDNSTSPTSDLQSTGPRNKSTTDDNSISPEVRRSNRVRKPPDRLKL
ncbi:Uncharacterised protein r2_g1856 [Pycnogonum litorale]